MGSVHCAQPVPRAVTAHVHAGTRPFRVRPLSPWPFSEHWPPEALLGAGTPALASWRGHHTGRQSGGPLALSSAPRAASLAQDGAPRGHSRLHGQPTWGR